MKILGIVVAVSLIHMIPEDFLPQLYTIGTHYQIGNSVGRTFRRVIQEFYNQSSSLAEVTKFIQTDTGKSYYNGYLETVWKVFPEYVNELTGLTDGAGVSFTEAFSSMITPEMQAVMKVKGAQSCSDVYVADQQIAIGHNEDSPELVVKGRIFMVHATIVDQDDSIVEQFSSLTLPGLLSGSAFSFNGDGKVFTFNSLSPATVEADKIPRYFMNRATLGVKSQKDLEDLLHGLGVGAAYGFNLNYADIRNNSGFLTNYEVSPISGAARNLVTKTIVARQAVPGVDITGHFFHFNMYERTNITQLGMDIVSSQHRKARAQTLPPPVNVLGIRRILGDEGDSQYPLYRTPRPSDAFHTTITGIFVLDDCVLMMYTSNPWTTPRPISTINLPTGVMCRKKH
ncbi:uncharacterized protein LOC124143300 [Haliotis rufescens]|uniref:uncharacterized protein LOC124143300 n=1 Tax=Haliotis rufescens TaxID=6454 RepID=UPI00201EA286|nr:uncharacterized protein LOC124143300 [Haliotis rufescens]